VLESVSRRRRLVGGLPSPAMAGEAPHARSSGRPWASLLRRPGIQPRRRVQVRSARMGVPPFHHVRRPGHQRGGRWPRNRWPDDPRPPLASSRRALRLPSIWPRLSVEAPDLDEVILKRRDLCRLPGFTIAFAPTGRLSVESKRILSSPESSWTVSPSSPSPRRWLSGVWSSCPRASYAPRRRSRGLLRMLPSGYWQLGMPNVLTESTFAFSGTDCGYERDLVMQHLITIPGQVNQAKQ
jgi:hypothetical protein